LALSSGSPVWTVPATAMSFEALFGAASVWLLRRSGIDYAPPLGPAVRIGIIVAICAACLAWLVSPSAGALEVVSLGLGALVATPLLAWCLRVLTPVDRAILQTIARRKGAEP
jgi:hypothetical protein